MKLQFTAHNLFVTREETDKKYYGDQFAAGESRLLFDIKNALNKQGYYLVKKRMHKDGHLVDDIQQYLRTRKRGAGKADIHIYSPFFALRGANEDFNNGYLALNVDYDIFS